jgi:phosphoribosyl 1,2-cyclic phosphate phosphodiesterase
MRITFLGTGASTSYPLAFCRCEYCNRARRVGGKDHRKRSSIVINDDLLIDMGPDIVTASFLNNLPVSNIRYCLQTHSHSDHFDAAHLTTRIPEYGGVNQAPIQIYASLATLTKMSEMLAYEGYVSSLFSEQDQKRMNVEVFPVKNLQSFEVGNYFMTAFKAEHDSSIEALLFSITENHFSVFYGTDTDTLPEETWQGFHLKRLAFDIVILDHTYGPDSYGDGHLNANRFIEQIMRLKEENLLSENARILATHLSHEGNPPHDELSEYARLHGYEIAYDGLVIDGSLR